MQLCCITKVVQLLQTKKIFVQNNSLFQIIIDSRQSNSSSDFPVI